MRSVLILGAAIGMALTSPVAAQDFPSRAIEVTVPYAPGGATDLAARILADAMSRAMNGATIVIMNKPGGGGSIGTGAILKAAPTGYELGTGAQGPLALLPHYGSTTYSINDVDFLGLVGRNLQMVVACKGAKFTDFDSFLAYARKNPGTVLVGNTGTGGANHLSMEAFGKVVGATFEHVPFSGAGEGMPNCAGGHIDAMVASPSEVRPYLEARSVVPLFIMEQKRLASLPDVPTAVEKGYNFTWSSWKGIIAPKGIPQAARAKLTAAIAAAVKDPNFIERMEKLGEYVDYLDDKAFEALARSDSQRAEVVIRELGMYGMNKKK